MALTKDDVVNYLSNMPVIELAELIKTLEDKWGVTAAAPVAVAMPGAGGRGGVPHRPLARECQPADLAALGCAVRAAGR